MRKEERRGVAACLAACLCCMMMAGIAHGQTPGTWRNYTSMKDVRGIASAGTTFWAASGGGLFQWDVSKSSFLRLTAADGLLNINLSSVAIAPDGSVWAGSSNGYVYAYLPSSGTLRVIRDIADASQTYKIINAIRVVGDTVLLSTDFGLSLFLRTKFEFADTYTHFGSIPVGSRMSVRTSLIAGGRLWAGISNGSNTNYVASAPLAGTNLLSPDSWTLEQAGPTGAQPTALVTVGARIYVATTSGLYFRDNSGVWLQVTGFNGKSIVAAAASASRLFVAMSTKEVYAVDSLGNLVKQGPSLPAVPTSMTIDPQGAPAVGIAGGGIMTLDSAWTAHFPEGPASNQFTNVSVDANGVVWGTSGPQNGLGFYRFDGQHWRNYSMSNSPLPANEIYRASTSCKGSVWLSSWGGGIVEFPGGGTTLDSAHVYNTNVGMVGIPNDLSYVVTSNAVCDRRGNTWISVLNPADKNILAVRKADGSWVHFPIFYNGVKITNLVENAVDRALAVDGEDNLWAVARDPAYRGVLCLANGGNIDSTASILLTSSSGLPSDGVQTIVVDRDNTLWVGTDRGIAIIVDPSNPLASNAIASYKPLLGQSVNSIAVDPLNQKWVGTPEGVVLLSSDGTQELASYTFESTNGQLMDNIINGIDVDPQTGTVFFATAGGLASLKTLGAAPVQGVDALKVYPNPFHLPAKTSLTIEGLQANSQLKILAADGTLIRDLKSVYGSNPGGKFALWDGKNNAGNDAASGIYFIIGYTDDGSVVKGKVAVLKK